MPASTGTPRHFLSGDQSPKKFVHSVDKLLHITPLCLTSLQKYRRIIINLKNLLDMYLYGPGEAKDRSLAHNPLEEFHSKYRRWLEAESVDGVVPRPLSKKQNRPFLLY